MQDTSFGGGKTQKAIEKIFWSTITTRDIDDGGGVWGLKLLNCRHAGIVGWVKFVPHLSIVGNKPYSSIAAMLVKIQMS